MRNAYISVGKPGGNRPFGRPKHRQGDNIELDLRDIGCDTVDWIHLAQDKHHCKPLVNMIMNF